MKRRMFVLGGILAIAGLLGFLAFSGIGKNLVYYWGPTELKNAGSKAEGATIRLGGLVEAGSIQPSGTDQTLRFRVTDGKASVPVEAHAVPPAMFREGIGIVVEGTVDAAGTFQTDRLMVKHDNQYKAPAPGQPVDIKQMMQDMKFDEATK